ncbi:ALKBH3 [Symbiodinium pilosum]|uniref:ALKBH3 protein n=1 Tax=Symbiodinium pilosum TaxID=2952 RepID=A0A812XE89_SYMPI|nr:ALKBH3 [Symbiodinium pilosum]
MVFFECDCAYRYGRIEVKPQQYPQWMCTLMHWVMPCCGINEQKDWPNSCNLNLYESGGMSVGWHADDEQLFQGKQQDCRIISLSLGATRAFEVRSNWSELDGTVRLELGDGDLCTMEGLVQKHFQHRVPREDKASGPRINLTWRWIVRHAAHCPHARGRR